MGLLLSIFIIDNNIKISTRKSFAPIHILYIRIASKDFSVFAVITILVYFESHFIKDEYRDRMVIISIFYFEIVLGVRDGDTIIYNR